jgi:predicted O-methyltransferase YrrM
MSQELWEQVDAFIAPLLREDEPLRAALRDSASLPNIAVMPSHGKLLHLLLRAAGARRVLEIGTLGGYSAIWMGSALPAGGRLLTLEVSEEHAAVARANIERAGLARIVEVRVGPALETLPQLEADGPFDFVFIDADKPPTTEYFDWAVRLTRSGGLIFVDNVVRDGGILEPSDDAARGMRRFLDTLPGDDRVSATLVQTVGSKGYDGFVLAFCQ